MAFSYRSIKDHILKINAKVKIRENTFETFLTWEHRIAVLWVCFCFLVVFCSICRYCGFVQLSNFVHGVNYGPILSKLLILSNFVHCFNFVNVEQLSNDKICSFVNFCPFVQFCSFIQFWFLFNVVWFLSILMIHRNLFAILSSLSKYRAYWLKLSVLFFRIYGILA